MPEQRELLLTFPELAPEAPLIPVRMASRATPVSFTMRVRGRACGCRSTMNLLS